MTVKSNSMVYNSMKTIISRGMFVLCNSRYYLQHSGKLNTNIQISDLMLTLEVDLLHVNIFKTTKLYVVLH
jgi:hypothetical protein